MTITSSPSISSSLFGITRDGRRVEEFILTSGSGLVSKILAYGGIVRVLEVPNRYGESIDVVLGFDTLAQYEQRHPYLGTITGRYANRIAKGIFELEGERYQLAVNNGPNHLHGGLNGFDRMIWTAKQESDGEVARLLLSHTSADGEEGYPGELKVDVVYSVSASNELRIDYRATTSRPTVVNLTNHSYFNLKGHDQGDILDHRVFIRAKEYLPVDSTSIPLGNPAEVSDTPFDFRTPILVGERINQVDPGYDHNYCLDDYGRGLRSVAEVFEDSTGIKLEVLTTEPGMQLYTGNYLSDSLVGKGDARYRKHAGLCLETQHYPDSPNRPDFPSTILRPGEEYVQTTIYRFESASL
jgi:aldose 1-epimerase